MGIDVRAERVIACPRDEVATFAMDPDKDPVWVGGIKAARRLSDGAFGAGSTVERVAQFLGRRIEYVMQVDAYQPPDRIVMRSIKAPFPMLVTYAFDPVGEATRASIRIQGDAGRYYRFAGPLLAMMVRRSITRDLRNLARVLERRPS